MNVHFDNDDEPTLTPFDGDGWFYPGDAPLEATDEPERLEDTVRAGRLRTLVGRVLIVPSAIVGFFGASDIDSASAAHRAAMRPTVHVASQPGPTPPLLEDPKPATSVPEVPAPPPASSVANVPVDKTARVKPAKKKRPAAAPQPLAPVAPSSSAPESPPPGWPSEL